MADRNPDNPELAVDDLKRKARRRLVGAVVLALAAAVLLPMLLEKEPRPLGEDVSVKIPPIDDGRFVNKLSGKDAAPAMPAAKLSSPPAAAKIETAAATPALAKSEPAPAEPARAEPAPPAAAATPAKPEAVAPAPAKAAPTPTPAPAAPKRSVAEAEQRMLSPSSKPAAPAAAKSSSAPVTTAAPEPPPAAPATTVASTTTTAPPPAPAAKVEAPPAAPAATPPPTSAPATQGFVVQLAAFADDKGANALAGRLKRGGYAAYVEPLQTSRGTLWRVRVGGYATRAEADAASEKLKGEGQKPMVVPVR